MQYTLWQDIGMRVSMQYTLWQDIGMRVSGASFLNYCYVKTIIKMLNITCIGPDETNEFLSIFMSDGVRELNDSLW
jgi:hypothetical protein